MLSYMQPQDQFVRSSMHIETMLSDVFVITKAVARRWAWQDSFDRQSEARVLT